MGLRGAVDRIDRSLGFHDEEGQSRWVAWQARRQSALWRVRAAELGRRTVFVSSAAAGAGGVVAAVAVPAPGGLVVLAGGAAVAIAGVLGGRRITAPDVPVGDEAPPWFPEVRRTSPAFPLLRRAVSARTVLDRVAAAGGPLALVVHDASVEGQRLVAELAQRVATWDDHVAQAPGLPAHAGGTRSAVVADLERAVLAYEELAGTVLVEAYGTTGGSAPVEPTPDQVEQIAEFVARIEGVRAAARTTR